MNKIFTLAMALLLSLSMTTTVLAAPFQVPESHDFNMELRLNLDIETPDTDANLDLMLAFLRDVRINAQGTVIGNMEDPQDIHLHMEIELYAGILYIPLAIWIDADFTDTEDPEFIIVIEMPLLLQSLLGSASPELAKPYWVMDSRNFPVTLLEEAAERAVPPATHPTFIHFSPEDMMSMMPEIEDLGGNQFRWAVSDDDFTDVIRSIIEIILYEMPDEEIFDEEVAEIVVNVIDNITILSEDWVSYYTLNDDGFVVQMNSRVQFIFDLLEWVKAIALHVDEDIDFMDIPEIVITLTLEYSVTYENINTARPVPLPELTPENSTNIFELFESMFN